MSDPLAEHEALAALASEAAEEIAARYRIDPAAARATIAELWGKNRKLLAAAAEGEAASKLRRRRVVKDATRDAARTIYYELRRYRRDDEELATLAGRFDELDPPGRGDGAAHALCRALAAAHVSTAERLGHETELHEAIAAHLRGASSVLDVGSGVHPLLFPFERFSVQRYLALDRDVHSIAALEAYARWRTDGVLEPRRWSLAEGWPPDERFDVALLLKVVPVVARQEEQLLPLLAQAPARVLVVTGSRQAMAHRRDIAKRELGVLQRFATQTGRTLIAELETTDEVGLLLR